MLFFNIHPKNTLRSLHKTQALSYLSSGKKKFAMSTGSLQWECLAMSCHIVNNSYIIGGLTLNNLISVTYIYLLYNLNLVMSPH